MNNYREIMVTLAKRGALAVLIFGAGWWMLAAARGGFAAIGQLLYGFALLILAAILIAPSVARLVAERSGGMFYPGRHSATPQPMYSIPEAKRKRGLSQEAFDDFQAISQQHPQELKPYIEMIDIAIMDMKNGALADAIFHHGMQVLEREEDRAALTRVHEAISSRLQSGSPPPRRTITVDP